jgi:adenylosuccinate synthase
MQDLLDEKILKKKIVAALEPKRLSLRPFAKDPALDLHTMTEQYHTFGHQLERYIADTPPIVWDALDSDRIVVFEGAQGAMLDLDHGTYPFVTSSNPVAGAACVGAGVGPREIDDVWGIAKAYTTRVGAGPFPTELFDEDGEALRRIGGEYGVTTGRDRRCGWFDAPIARYAARVNGLTDFFLTKLDVLTGWKQIPVCVAYDVDGVRHDELPMTQTDFHHAKPVYEFLPGWDEDISKAREFADLPDNAQAYVRRLEELSGAPISAIGVGQDRNATIQIRSFL